ncbi:MAG: 50S ribosomal protein L20 [Rickettsiales bacterium]
MAHAKSGANRARRKKILKMAKGYRGRSKNCITVARQKVEKGLQYAYRDRRVKKRTFRSLWIQRINAGVREHGMVYSQFMSGLAKAGIEVDRKVLSDLAIHEPAAFKAIVEQSKSALKKAA